MLRRAKLRVIAITWLLFAALLIALFLDSSFRPFRSFLSLVPLICIAAGVAFSDLIDWTLARNHRWVLLGIVIAALCICVGSLGFSSFQQAQRRITHRDTRLQAVEWLQQNARQGETILAIRELSILPEEWKRIAANAIVVPWFEAADFLERQQFDYIVTGEFDLRYASDPNGWSTYRDRWKAKLRPLPVETNFGQIPTPVVPYLWRTNDERIRIIRGRALDR